MGKIKPSKLLPLDSRANRPQEKVYQTPVSVSFKYADVGGSFCLGKHIQKEVRGVIDCLKKLTTMTWMDVLRTSGKRGNKVGLGYTPYPDKALRHVTRPQALSEDIPISAIRASGKARVFGAYQKHVYYILWFDRNHKIVPV